MCDQCGVDHAQELQDALPEIALLNKAEEWMKTTQQEEVITSAVGFFFENVVRANQNEVIRMCQENGDPPFLAVSHFAELMMKSGFVIGAATGHAYRENIPECHITDEERTAFVEEHWDDQKRAEEAEAKVEGVPSPSEIVRILKEAGAVPENWDGKIEFVVSEEVGIGGDEPPVPGMYL